ncbi:LysR family transcriptional regulator [Hephaestia sp. GCM10023244]|uniref:LysR family transcriptional regulator n=1 Tax=unclassified Hephaestia TaxID=2631281 RepID=UPI0020774E67|nr:LysR family transcriptional regulator [Hephaestia sp. MAHUQ-44]MCM8730384.1 LysR family transcriptional regulator [Hephaestia sp. MAHUQ-44]
MQYRPAYMQQLPWNDLQDFLAIARAGKLSRAAARLGVDPTTIGRRLRRLERRLGRTLFEQTREGQVLTEAGEALLAHVEAMQRAAERISEQPKGHPLSGLLRISVSEGFGTWFVAHHLHDFVDRYPQLTVDLVATSGFLSPSKRETDVALLLARPQAGPVVSSKLSDYRLCLYGGSDYLARHGTPGTPDELTGHRLIGYIPDLLYAPELRYLGEINENWVATVRSSSINAQYRLIQSGSGVGVLPRFIGDADPTLVPLLPGIEITRSFWIVTHKDTRQLERVRVFKAWLLETVRRHRIRLLGG